jgi:hypothetical protein
MLGLSGAENLFFKERLSMTHSSSGLWFRVRNCVEQWVHSRLQECIHCRECDSEIKPFVTHCPTCGQANPAKVSATAAIYPAIVGIFLTLALLAAFDIF